MSKNDFSQVLIMEVAPYNTTVLISGERGTGKELVARAIHQNSPRRKKPFIDVNCAAIPKELIESELFGYEQGAHSTATKEYEGKFEQADGGTIFFDEISDMDSGMQAKVLRVLEEREITRLGGKDKIRVDIRVIAATNKNLDKAIEADTFRKDLLDRINVFPISVPSLRERSEEIPLLARCFIDGFCDDQKKLKKKITSEAMKLLKTYSWPGNVRELKNLMERLVIAVDSPTIQEDDILPIMKCGNGADSSHKQSDTLDEIREKHYDPVELGKRLKTARADIGLTQLAVAEKLGLHRPAISQIESGRRKVDSIELKKLASLYKKPVSYFL
jgi:two-component system nitrogen regulation response regulator NtrX